MTKEQLGKAKYLEQEIKMLDNYIWHQDRSFLTKLLKESIKTVTYNLGEEELELNSELKSRIRKVIDDYKVELETELNKL
jgi:division protein CdvB (Snf7/Vps24/ESCRT-III family)